jgi:hypothetical protein
VVLGAFLPDSDHEPIAVVDRARMVNTSPLVPGRINDPDPAEPAVDIVVPVYNEQAALGMSITRLHAYLSGQFPFSWRITIADNASTDGTWAEAERLARDLSSVRARHLDRKGRGLALREAWMHSDAAVVAYMDVDLSTDLDALLPLVAPLVSGHSDVAIGSRLAPGASVARRPKREFISRCYNALLHLLFATKVRDAQCGFKAVRADIARVLVPAVEDNGWFFDTELLMLAERNGLRIHEVPVDWIDDADSRVSIVHTVAGDVAGSARLVRTFLRGGGRVELGDIARQPVPDDFGRRLVSFAAIGALSTAVSLPLFLWWRDPMGAIAANACAVTATFFANTWMHARITARLQRPQWFRAIAVYVGSLALTSCALVAVQAAHGGLPAELAALAVTWTAATLARLALLDHRSARPQECMT